jgi:pimeloyl-ACP methyl ester carboxylesterase
MNAFRLDQYLYRKLSPQKNHSFSFLQTESANIRFFDSGDNSKPTLLTAPDGPCFIEHFQEYIEKAKKNWRVVILDMPGFGESYPLNGYNHSFESGANALKRLVDHLSLGDITLSLSCGNGFYGIYFAKKYPELIKKLILIQTPGFKGMRPWLRASVPTPVKMPYIGQLLVYLQRHKIPKVWFKVALPKHSEYLSSWSELSKNRIEKSCCNCLASVVQGFAAMKEDDLLGCEVPTLMIWGKKDYSHRFTDESSLRDVIPNVDIVIWDDCGHFPELEQTDRYLDMINV